MVSLDSLVVTTALPVIRTDLAASLAQPERAVSAYALTFTVFLLTGAARAWIVLLSTATVPSAELIVPFVLVGVGMGPFFTPLADVVVSVRSSEEGQTSGANNTIRELRVRRRPPEPPGVLEQHECVGARQNRRRRTRCRRRARDAGTARSPTRRARGGRPLAKAA